LLVLAKEGDFPCTLPWHCSSEGFPLHLAEKYWPSNCSLAGVQYDKGLAERLQHPSPSFMLCPMSYLCLMWRDAMCIGKGLLPCLGCEVLPLAGLVSFC
jgi:hypothetical protein